MSSLHFVAAREDLGGVLVFSHPVNPYATEEHNVYRWAGHVLNEAARLLEASA